jgi:hypothetical protein
VSILVGGIAALAVAAGGLGVRASHHPGTGWTTSDLQLPAAGAPWLMAGTFDGSDIRLRVPEEWSAIRSSWPRPLVAKLAHKIELRDRNVSILAALGARTEAVLARTRLAARPEYLRSLSEVTLGVHPSDLVGRDPLHRHRPLLSRLPPYTRVHVFTPAALADAVRASLAAQGLSARAEVHAVPTWRVQESGIEISHETTTWVQDLFEPVTGEDGVERIVLPASHNQIEDLARPDNDYVDELAGPGREVLRLPVFFRPGNLLLGVAAGTRTLFIGSQEVEFERSDTYGSSLFLPPADAFLRLVDQVYGADRHVLLPNSEHLFHVDMAMVFLGDGKVGVLDPVDPEALEPGDRAVLGVTRQALAAEGFRIVSIPTATAWMRRFQSPVNVLTFTDRRDGRHRAFVPRYPEPPDLGARGRGLNDRVRAAYRAEGFDVVSVEDRFDEKHGDVHCAFNVLR